MHFRVTGVRYSQGIVRSYEGLRLKMGGGSVGRIRHLIRVLAEGIVHFGSVEIAAARILCTSVSRECVILKE